MFFYPVVKFSYLQARSIPGALHINNIGKPSGRKPIISELHKAAVSKLNPILAVEHPFDKSGVRFFNVEPG